MPHEVPEFDLDTYEIRDPSNQYNWIPKPGYSTTLHALIEQKIAQGRSLSVEYLKHRAPLLGFTADDHLFSINRYGCKGPEIDNNRTHFRILTIGDSTTFGTWFDRYSYSRVLEQELANMGILTEVYHRRFDFLPESPI